VVATVFLPRRRPLLSTGLPQLRGIDTYTTNHHRRERPRANSTEREIRANKTFKIKIPPWIPRSGPPASGGGGVPDAEPLSPPGDEVSIKGGRRRQVNVPQEEEEEGPEDDILKLTQAPDWGQVGGATKEPVVPRLPVKPGVKVKAATASPRSKFPRDRLPTEATTFTADMKKMAAPGLGESTGHEMPINGRRNDGGSLSPRSKGEAGMFPAIDSARDSLGGGGSVSTQSPEAKRMLGLR
jgi:hypothetical protein